MESDRKNKTRGQETRRKSKEMLHSIVKEAKDERTFGYGRSEVIFTKLMSVLMECWGKVEKGCREASGRKNSVESVRMQGHHLTDRPSIISRKL